MLILIHKTDVLETGQTMAVLAALTSREAAPKTLFVKPARKVATSADGLQSRLVSGQIVYARRNDSS